MTQDKTSILSMMYCCLLLAAASPLAHLRAQEGMTADEIIDYFNEVTSSKLRYSKSSREPIHARLEEGFTKEECKLVIDFKHFSWKGTKYEQYLIPRTIFAVTKFEGYLNGALKWDSRGRTKLGDVPRDVIRKFR